MDRFDRHRGRPIAGLVATAGSTRTLVISLILLSIPIFVVGFVPQFLVGVKWHVAP